jgi:hypothetical protein
MTLGRKIVVALKAALTTWAIAILVLCVNSLFFGALLSSGTPPDKAFLAFVVFLGIICGIAPALVVALPLSTIFLFGAPHARRHGQLALYIFAIAVSLLVTSPSLLSFPPTGIRPEQLEPSGFFFAMAYGVFAMVTALPMLQLHSCCTADVSPQLLSWINWVAAVIWAMTPGLVLAAFWQREVRRSALPRPQGAAPIAA